MTDLALVGAGLMGANHARVARLLRHARVTHVHDEDRTRALRIAEPAGARVCGTLEDALEADAAIVAVPTDQHEAVTTTLLRAGVHVLVEKPLAPDVPSAQRIVEAAHRAGVVLQVGHVERFNPAVIELKRLVRDPLHIEIARVGPYSGRIRDGVIADLMIHDLDLARWLAGSEVTKVCATSRSVRGDTEDLANALLTFANGVTASLVASRVGQEKIRTISLTQADDYVTADLLRRTVTVNRVQRSEFLSDAGMSYRETGVTEVPFLERNGEPLLNELEDFVQVVRQGGTPLVTGADGLVALSLVEQVRRSAALN